MTRRASRTHNAASVAKPTDPGTLPPLYARWMRELLKAPVQGEAASTCDDCAMCSTPGSAAGASELFYNPETKCCTYVPDLPNFLVGRILADPDPAFAAGRESVRVRLRAQNGVTPMGIAQPATYELIYKNVPAAFGRSRSMRCPHYIDEGGRCGIWRHRASVCATWYCKYDRGAIGRSFWKTLHQLLSALQRTLVRWCVRDLERSVLEALFPAAAYPGVGRGIDSAEVDGKASPALYAASWGSWKGREEEFFLECARKVERLTWAQVLEIGGAEVEIFAKLLRADWAATRSEALPAAARAGPYRVVQSSPGSSRIVGYSDFDPIDVPSELLDLLGFFDGRPLREVLAEIEKERGVVLEEDLLRKLLDFQVLLPAK